MLQNTDTNNHESIIHIAEITLDGFPCLRYFGPETGKLCVVGPKGSRKACRRYVRKYEKLCESQKLRTSLSEIRTETPMNMKLHAFLHLVQEHEDDIAGGMPITADHFNTVLDSFTFHTEPVDRDRRFKALENRRREGGHRPPFFCAASASRGPPVAVGGLGGLGAMNQLISCLSRRLRETLI